MNVLAIETATDACSVAIGLNGNIVEEFAVIPKQHTRQIFLMLEALLAKSGVTFSQIDVLAFGRGPGSFTGLRIAAKNKMIEIRLVNGPLSQLEGFWRFETLSATSSRVVLDLEFEIAHRLFNLPFQAIFHQIANSLVDAFIERANTIYG